MPLRSQGEGPYIITHIRTPQITTIKIQIRLSFSLSLSLFPQATMSMSSSTLTSQAMVFATAMAAFSGTVILLAIKTHKSPSSLSSSSSSQFQPNPLPALRPCLSSGEKKGEKKKKKKKKKRVRFAEDVIDPTGDNEEFRRQKSSHARGNGVVESRKRSQNRGMPANRVALYNGILRDRVIHRFAYTY